MVLAKRINSNGGKLSRMGKKEVFPAYISVAFVWFCTHFGGGFASGRQLIDFYVSYGWFAIFMPIITVAILTWVYSYAWDFAFVRKTFDYRTWSNEFFYPYQKILANTYEILYLLIFLTGAAVAVSSGAQVITDVIGTSYVLNSVILSVIIFLLTIYGADLVRSASTIMGIIIIIMLVLYLSNLVFRMPELLTILKCAPTPSANGFWDAL